MNMGSSICAGKLARIRLPLQPNGVPQTVSANAFAPATASWYANVIAVCLSEERATPGKVKPKCHPKHEVSVFRESDILRSFSNSRLASEVILDAPRAQRYLAKG